MKAKSSEKQTSEEFYPGKFMAQKVSVIIPNFNGVKLLKKNLPMVIKNCPGCEIIVVDDASTDDSLAYLKENFKGVKVIAKTINKGFAAAVNSGVKAASGKFVLLLNSDVSPREKFLDPLLSLFYEHNNLFAVAAKDVSHEDGEKVEKGRGGAAFKKGFVNHYPLPIKKGETLWVSGGSGLFDRSQFLKLGGMDEIYAPFYWEDIDLSYRARKSGYICLIEPDSIVDHYHEEGAIKKYHTETYVKTISYKNQFIFVWLNITDYLLLIQHLLWLPFHFSNALLHKDWAFFLGFFKASLQFPKLVLNYQLPKSEIATSDKEIFKKFEKQ